MRTETKIFKDLEALCTKSGYVHVIAHLCFRDNYLACGQEINSDDISKMYNPNALIRTEISTLIGLAVKGKLNTDILSFGEIKKLIEDTERLLHELHIVLAEPFKIETGPDGPIHPPKMLFGHGKTIREPIFYAAESAYTFQYRDFASLKYAKDDSWLVKKKGFSLVDVDKVIRAIAEMQSNKMMSVVRSTNIKFPDKFVPFYAFTFTIDELVEQSKCAVETTQNILNAFSSTPTTCNHGFNGIGYFNETNASPIINLDNGKYLLFQYASIVEAFYESPFYWMVDNETYRNTAMEHRGNFTEKFCSDRLKSVFGKQNVFKNIKFIDQSGNHIGEIDVLVAYSNRAIILQAKSKKLTLEARKGNDNALRDDFKAAIQDSYDQGIKCAQYLNNQAFRILDANNNPLKLRKDFREIYLFSVVSDHYPSLAFQADQFLIYKTTDVVPPPFVMDIFFLDVLCELLDDPLHFLNFVQRRIKYSDRILGSNELAILSHHLGHNLWVSDDVDILQIGDDVCVGVDAAMFVRREGFPGNSIPEGILTKFKDHSFGKLIKRIGASEQDGVLDIGFFFLELSEDAAKSLGEDIDRISRLTLEDKKLHNISMMFGNKGFTFHASYFPEAEMARRLYNHCVLKKYKQKAMKWFGLAKNASLNNPFDIGLVLDNPWEYSEELEMAANDFVGSRAYPDLRTALQAKKKIGRNVTCPCGSGKKYKKCHGS